ncbi:MAG: ankyrin repeat domain-containing protein [Candidatus Micrarchaeota archaeon]|nr:ankyrin repeat domain-containing protein [Candidatus Micrarchaeota archaeon]
MVTELESAVFEGDTKAVAELIRKGVNVNEACVSWYCPGGNGMSPLHVAIYQGYNDIALLLMDNGADVNAKPNHGRSCLDYAVDGCNATRGDIEIILPLLKKGADVNAKDNHGRTVFGTARYSSRITAILEAASKGDFETVERLTEKAKIELDLTPLMLAVENDDRPRIAHLIENGANVNETARHGVTPLARAILKTNMYLTELLIEKGADVNARSTSKISPLGLIRGGCGCGSNTVYEYTPLHLAVLVRDARFAELLIAKGADLNAKDREGKTPADYARQFWPGRGTSRLEKAAQNARIRKAEEKGPGVADIRRMNGTPPTPVNERRIPDKRAS